MSSGPLEAPQTFSSQHVFGSRHCLQDTEENAPFVPGAFNNTHTHVRAHTLTHTSAFTVNSLVSMVIAISHLAHYTMFMFICEYSGIFSYICFI